MTKLTLTYASPCPPCYCCHSPSLLDDPVHLVVEALAKPYQEIHFKFGFMQCFLTNIPLILGGHTCHTPYSPYPAQHLSETCPHCPTLVSSLFYPVLPALSYSSNCPADRSASKLP